MSTLKGTRMHPQCRHIGACWDLLECWFQLFSTSQNKNQIQFWTFLKKKIKFFWFPCCSTYSWRPFHWRINYLCKTDIDEARTISFLDIRKLRVRTKFNLVNFELFWKQFPIFGFPWCRTCEDLSIYVSITNVGLILTKVRWFQLLVKSRISNFLKKFKFWGFHGVVLMKTFPLMYQLLM